MISVKDYLKQDRQWPRALRISHAEYRLNIASNGTEIAFWKAIISANKDDEKT